MPVEGSVVDLSEAAKNHVEIPRIETGMAGIDFVLSDAPRGEGGGIVPGSIILFCGDPGIGKSTALLQLLASLGKRRVTSLYVSGEEAVGRVAERAARLGGMPKNRMFAVRETDIDQIFESVDEHRPDVVAIDSVQVVSCTNNAGDELEAGSAACIRVAIREFRKYAEQTSTTFILIGHINKDGVISGPRALEAHVDTVIEFKGHTVKQRRVLRCDHKNRFGETPRAVAYQMTGDGLVEVDGDPDSRDTVEDER